MNMLIQMVLQMKINKMKAIQKTVSNYMSK